MVSGITSLSCIVNATGVDKSFSKILLTKLTHFKDICGAHISGEEPAEADDDIPKIYEPIESYEQLSTRLLMYQGMYNDSVRGADIDLVFFKVTIFIPFHFVCIQ